nr:unnamed protein product [Callosobruchus analis]
MKENKIKLIILQSTAAVNIEPITYLSKTPKPAGSFFMTPILEVDVKKAILYLKNSHCLNYYGLNSSMIKSSSNLNETKNQTIVFSSDKLQKKSEPVNFLGIVLDSGLNWHDHITYTCSRICSQIFALRQLNTTNAEDQRQKATVQLEQQREADVDQEEAMSNQQQRRFRPSEVGTRSGNVHSRGSRALFIPEDVLWDSRASRVENRN